MTKKEQPINTEDNKTTLKKNTDNKKKTSKKTTNTTKNKKTASTKKSDTTSKTSTKKTAPKKTTNSKTTKKSPSKKSSNKAKIDSPKIQTPPLENTTHVEQQNKPSYTPKADEAYMNDAQLQYFRDQLNHWKQEIIEESERTKEYLKDENTHTADLNDRASQEEEFSLELRTRDRQRKLMHKINRALERISLGDFGYCEQCGEEIGFKRLEARPTAELCIDCKQIAERKERGFFDER